MCEYFTKIKEMRKENEEPRVKQLQMMKDSFSKIMNDEVKYVTSVFESKSSKKETVKDTMKESMPIYADDIFVDEIV